jgi:hypothetical protein
MEAYCNTVCHLEDKFDGLELNHVARKYNEEADELAKIASGRSTVPPNVFARDLAKPYVDLKNPVGASRAATEPAAEDPSTGESEAMEMETEISSADEAEAMQIDEAPLS